MEFNSEKMELYSEKMELYSEKMELYSEKMELYSEKNGINSSGQDLSHHTGKSHRPPKNLPKPNYIIQQVPQLLELRIKQPIVVLQDLHARLQPILVLPQQARLRQHLRLLAQRSDRVGRAPTSRAAPERRKQLRHFAIAPVGLR
jgi:hypothetical protein